MITADGGGSNRVDEDIAERLRAGRPPTGAGDDQSEHRRLGPALVNQQEADLQECSRSGPGPPGHGLPLAPPTRRRALRAPHRRARRRPSGNGTTASLFLPPVELRLLPFPFLDVPMRCAGKGKASPSPTEHHARRAAQLAVAVQHGSEPLPRARRTAPAALSLSRCAFGVRRKGKRTGTSSPLALQYPLCATPAAQLAVTHRAR